MNKRLGIFHINGAVPMRAVSALIVVVLLFCGANLYAAGAKVPDIMHPMKQPKMYTKNLHCSNCGMMVNMWARTRHAFSTPDGEYETCSIRCMADFSSKTGVSPAHVQVAIYAEPERMIAAEEAFYVIGSTAKGTMTTNSKIAFADQRSAKDFSDEYGGKVVRFPEAFEMATDELLKMPGNIEK